MDSAAAILMAFTILNGAILSFDLLFNIYHSIFPL